MAEHGESFEIERLRKEITAEKVKVREFAEELMKGKSAKDRLQIKHEKL